MIVKTYELRNPVLIKKNMLSVCSKCKHLTAHQSDHGTYGKDTVELLCALGETAQHIGNVKNPGKNPMDFSTLSLGYSQTFCFPLPSRCPYALEHKISGHAISQLVC